MKYLKIKSKNEIPVHALSLMGASTKRDNSELIGKYGSGGKYSLSTMIRNNVDFKIFSGEEEIKVTTERVNFRDKSFDKIIINGETTSLTTEMGGQEWDNSFSYIREIYSNALDEDKDTTLEVTSNITGQKGYTCYYIEFNKNVEDFYKNIHNYFCFNNPNVLFSNDHITTYSKATPDVRLFRKGILCSHDDKKKSVFDYNSTHFKINESRILSDTWELKYILGRGWKSCNSYEAIAQLMHYLQGGNAGFLEHQIEWSSSLVSFSPVWLEWCKNKKFVGVEHKALFEPSDLEGAIQLQFDLLKELKNQFPEINVLGLSYSSEDTFVEVSQPKKHLVDKVLDALQKLYKTDYVYRLDNPIIKYGNFSAPSTLAQAFNGEILLATKLDTYSVDEIAKIIIEENEHNITGYGDKTRNFQNHLFNLYYDELLKCSDEKNR